MTTDIVKAFKPGDVVELRSGGLFMTVYMSDSEGNVVCNWHDDNGRPHGKIYCPAMLRIVEDEEETAEESLEKAEKKLLKAEELGSR